MQPGKGNCVIASVHGVLALTCHRAREDLQAQLTAQILCCDVNAYSHAGIEKLKRNLSMVIIDPSN